MRKVTSVSPTVPQFHRRRVVRSWRDDGLSYIEPGAPWQNAYVESFNGHLRSEHLDLESFNTLLEAQILLDDWRLEYNRHRPHQSLNYQTPTAFARDWHADHDNRPS